jgi:Tfp pilus assembly protein PilZ
VRYVLHPSLECLCIYSESGQRIERPAHIKNISQGGLLMTTGETKIYPGKEVELRFELPGRQETFTVRGRVVRTYRKEYRSWHYSGVQFENREDANIKTLLNFVCE